MQPVYKTIIQLCNLFFVVSHVNYKKKIEKLKEMQLLQHMRNVYNY